MLEKLFQGEDLSTVLLIIVILLQFTILGQIVTQNVKAQIAGRDPGDCMTASVNQPPKAYFHVVTYPGR